MMSPKMRVARILALLLAGAVSPALYAQAGAFPERPLRLLVGYAPGGSTDIVGRLVATQLAAALGRPVVVENRPGASGALASGELARAMPDGHTLLVHIVTTAVIGPLTQKGLPFDAQKDFQPVAMVAKLPNVLIINKDIPARTLREFIAWVRANPGKVSYGTGGAGSVQHLSGELLNKMAGLDMVHVPYKGAAPAIQDLMGGNIAAVFDNITGTIGPIRSGAVRILGVTTEERVAALPDAPTLAESGLPQFKNSSWISIFTRSGVPAPVLTRLETATLQAATHADTVAKLKELGALPSPMNAAQLDAFWKSEFDYWRSALKTANVKLD
jgi:tripartite-type tricarboxylate transporter receptor subunit TctC